MKVLQRSVSVVVRLAVLFVLGLAFFVGMVGTIWFSLRGEEIKVPEIVGKDFYEGERELESLGLKIKRRSFRYSKEKPNTILEQSPRPGETVKTGQTILVVVAQENPESTEVPAPIKKDKDDLFPSIEDVTRSPKSTNAKRPERTRDIIKSRNANLSNSEMSRVSENKNANVNKKKEDGNSETKPKPTLTPTKTPSDLPGGFDVRNRRVIP